MTTTEIETTEEALYSTSDVLASSGMSYRMLDHWLRTGVVVLVSDPKTGSGGRRVFTEAEVHAVKRLYDRYQATLASLDFIRSGQAWMEETVSAGY